MLLLAGDKGEFVVMVGRVRKQLSVVAVRTQPDCLISRIEWAMWERDIKCREGGSENRFNQFLLYLCDEINDVYFQRGGNYQVIFNYQLSDTIAHKSQPSFISVQAI